MARHGGPRWWPNESGDVRQIILALLVGHLYHAACGSLPCTDCVFSPSPPTPGNHALVAGPTPPPATPHHMWGAMPYRPPVHGEDNAPARKHRPVDAGRPSASVRGYDRKWQKLRLMKLARNPLCEACDAMGDVAAAEEVDHIVPVARGGALMDITNLQSLCKMHHSRKTVLEDGGLGREPAGG